MTRTSHPESEASDAGQEYCLLRGRTASLRANVNALAALDRMVRDGIRAFPKRGLEIGGLLTGSRSAGKPAGPDEGEDEVPEEIRLDTVCPLPMEYRSSPAFQPSPADILFIKQSVVRAQASQTRIVGHFRSQTSGEIRPSDVDRNIANVLNLSEGLLVLIPASAAGVEPARLYRAVNGEWTFLLSFPLVEQPLVESPVEPAMPQLLGVQEDATPARLVTVPSRSRWYPWALAGLVVGVAAGAFVSHSVWKDQPAVVLPTRPDANKENSDVHLELHPSGPALTVEWNAASPLVAKGFSGMLTVQDGGRQLQIPLDRQQLETGRTVYYPDSGWVEVRLEVYRDGNHFTGETVAAATGLSKPSLAKIAADAKSPDIKPTNQAAKPLVAENPTEKLKLAAFQAKETGSAGETAAYKPRLQLYRGPTEARTASPPAPLPVAPQISLAAPPAAVLPSPVLPSAPPEQPTDATGSPGRTIRFEAAVPIRKVRPSVPDDLHSILPEATSIVIRVEIDAVGRVVSAAPSGNLTPTQKLLAPQAVQAARLWRFQPARKNGEAVESESLLRFDFEREDREGR